MNANSDSKSKSRRVSLGVDRSAVVDRTGCEAASACIKLRFVAISLVCPGRSWCSAANVPRGLVGGRKLADRQLAHDKMALAFQDAAVSAGRTASP
jgi:hypothetical protein